MGRPLFVTGSSRENTDYRQFAGWVSPVRQTDSVVKAQIRS